MMHHIAIVFAMLGQSEHCRTLGPIVQTMWVRRRWAALSGFCLVCSAYW